MRVHILCIMSFFCSLNCLWVSFVGPFMLRCFTILFSCDFPTVRRAALLYVYDVACEFICCVLYVFCGLFFELSLAVFCLLLGVCCCARLVFQRRVPTVRDAAHTVIVVYDEYYFCLSVMVYLPFVVRLYCRPYSTIIFYFDYFCIFHHVAKYF